MSRSFYYLWQLIIAFNYRRDRVHIPVYFILQSEAHKLSSELEVSILSHGHHEL